MALPLYTNLLYNINASILLGGTYINKTCTCYNHEMTKKLDAFYILLEAPLVSTNIVVLRLDSSTNRYYGTFTNDTSFALSKTYTTLKINACDARYNIITSCAFDINNILEYQLKYTVSLSVFVDKSFVGFTRATLIKGEKPTTWNDCHAAIAKFDDNLGWKWGVHLEDLSLNEKVLLYVKDPSNIYTNSSITYGHFARTAEGVIELGGQIGILTNFQYYGYIAIPLKNTHQDYSMDGPGVLAVLYADISWGDVSIIGRPLFNIDGIIYYNSSANHSGWVIPNDANRVLTTNNNMISNGWTQPLSSQKAAIQFEKVLIDISSGAFEHQNNDDKCNLMTKISLPQYIKEIKEHAFKNDTSLYEITYHYLDNDVETEYPNNTLPPGVTQIADELFENCINLGSTKKFYISYQIKSIGNYSFSACSLTSGLSFGSNSKLNEIGDYAFVDSQLNTSTFPSSLEKIGRNAFAQCQNLTSFNIPKNVTYIGDEAFRDCLSLETVNINVLNNGKTPLKTIPYLCFYYCNSLANINSENGINYIPEGINTIGERAFYIDPRSHNGFTNITIPRTLRETKLDPFTGHNPLTSILWNSDATSTEYVNYNNSAVTPFNYNCEYILNISFGEYVSYIPHYLCYSFTNLNHTKVTFPARINYIGNYAFYANLNLREHIYNASDASTPKMTIGNYAFAGNRLLLNINLPNKTYVINKKAFNGCQNAQQIKFGLSTNKGNITSNDKNIMLKDIGEYAFKDCKDVSSDIIIPYNTKNIKDLAFANCNNIKTVYWRAYLANTYINNSEDKSLLSTQYADLDHIPTQNELNAAKELYLWSWTRYPQSGTYSDITATYTHVIDNQVTNSSHYEIYINNNESFSIFDNVDWNNSSYYEKNHASKVYTINFIDGCYVIPTHIAYNLRSLTKISISPSVIAIDDEAFCYCSKLSHRAISDLLSNGLRYIESNAFAYTYKLLTAVNEHDGQRAKWMAIPHTVTIIGEKAFYDTMNYEGKHSNEDLWHKIGGSTITFILGCCLTHISYDVFNGKNCYWEVGKDVDIISYALIPPSLDIWNGTVSPFYDINSDKLRNVSYLILPNFDECENLYKSTGVGWGTFGRPGFNAYQLKIPFRVKNGINYYPKKTVTDYNNEIASYAPYILATGNFIKDDNTPVNGFNTPSYSDASLAALKTGDYVIIPSYLDQSDTNNTRVIGIADEAFRACFISGDTFNIKIPNTIEFIGPRAFMNSYIKNVLFESTPKIKTIADFAFYNCLFVQTPNNNDIKFFNIADSVTCIGAFAFANRLERLGLNPYNHNIDISNNYAMTINIGKNLSEIEDYAFFHTYINHFIVDSDNLYYKSVDDTDGKSNGLYSKNGDILYYAIPDSNNEFVFPNDVRYVFHLAFSDWIFNKITFNNNIQTIKDNENNNNNSNCSFYIRKHCGDALKTDKLFTYNENNMNTIIFADSTAITYKSMFKSENIYKKYKLRTNYTMSIQINWSANILNNIETVVFKENVVKTISAECCKDMKNLELTGHEDEMHAVNIENTIGYLYIPHSVTSIGEDAFNGCKKLNKICYNGTADEWRNINKANNKAFNNSGFDLSSSLVVACIGKYQDTHIIEYTSLYS